MQPTHIEAVIAITNSNKHLVKPLMGGNMAPPSVIAQLLNDTDAHMQRVSDAPFRHNPVAEPDVLEWVWARKNDDGSLSSDTNKMIGTFVRFNIDENNKVTKEPFKWVIGKNAAAIAIYRNGCCPNYSALMMLAKPDGSLMTRIKDDIDTLDDCKQLFAKPGKISFDKDGHHLAHSYEHIMHRDEQCNHGHQHEGSSHGLVLK